ncbi:MAG: LytTR family transcriptional regulator DNA-binding domain-containing protein [Lachnospiraceae bacterium]|nr:LytTR family transcriptional regulator DNA-binding domain-containing protein [Lachnospiraceae bacterium]
MIYLLTLHENDNEKKELSEVYRELAAKLTDDYWDLHFSKSVKECADYLKEEPILDFLCMDVCVPDCISFLAQMRRKYSDSPLALVTDIKTPPTFYLKPGIRPDMILVKPFERKTVEDSLEEFFRDRLSKMEEKEGDMNSFVVETRDGKTFIPFRQIYYFEAREKKIFLRTLHEEYGFYATIEELTEKLPDTFVRTHRSFIINKNTVETIKGNNVYLRKGFCVPVSRSYKGTLIEALRG